MTSFPITDPQMHLGNSPYNRKVHVGTLNSPDVDRNNGLDRISNYDDLGNLWLNTRHSGLPGNNLPERLLNGEMNPFKPPTA